MNVVNLTKTELGCQGQNRLRMGLKEKGKKYFIFRAASREPSTSYQRDGAGFLQQRAKMRSCKKYQYEGYQCCKLVDNLPEHIL